MTMTTTTAASGWQNRSQAAVFASQNDGAVAR